MAKPRKKWAVQLSVPSAELQRHTSEANAYAHVGAIAKGFAAGDFSKDVRKVNVFVDEGRGWELFDRVDLRELAEMQAALADQHDKEEE